MTPYMCFGPVADRRAKKLGHMIPLPMDNKVLAVYSTRISSEDKSTKLKANRNEPIKTKIRLEYFFDSLAKMGLWTTIITTLMLLDVWPFN